MQDSPKTITKLKLKREAWSSLQVYELPVDTSQKRCSKCMPSAQTHAVRRQCHWRIAASDRVVHLSPFSSAFLFINNNNINVTTTSSQSKSGSDVTVKFNY